MDCISRDILINILFPQLEPLDLLALALSCKEAYQCFLEYCLVIFHRLKAESCSDIGNNPAYVYARMKLGYCLTWTDVRITPRAELIWWARITKKSLSVSQKTMFIAELLTTNMATDEIIQIYIGSELSSSVLCSLSTFAETVFFLKNFRFETIYFSNMIARYESQEDVDHLINYLILRRIPIILVTIEVQTCKFKLSKIPLTNYKHSREGCYRASNLPWSNNHDVGLRIGAVYRSDYVYGEKNEMCHY